MKAVIQRVTSSSVTVDGKIVGEIGQGLNILLGVVKGDSDDTAELLARKIAQLRIFRDEAGKMNRSILDVGGAALVVSQFTICADLQKGNRPSFINAALPREAEVLYESFCNRLRYNGVAQVETGVFGADMDVKIENQGPVTILMDTDVWKGKEQS